MNFNIISNQKGFSLVGVLVAASVMALVAVATHQMIISQTKGISYLEDRLARVDMETMLKNHFTNPESCTKTFETLTERAEIVVNELKDQDGNVYKKNIFESEYVKIPEMKLMRNHWPRIGANSNGKMDFTVNLKRDRGSLKMGARQLQPINLVMNVVTGPGSVITSCSYMGSSGRATASTSVTPGTVDDKSCIVDVIVRVGNQTWNAGPGYPDQEIQTNFRVVKIVIPDGGQVTDTFEIVRAVLHRGELYNQTVDCTNRIASKTRTTHVNAIRLISSSGEIF